MGILEEVLQELKDLKALLMDDSGATKVQEEKDVNHKPDNSAKRKKAKGKKAVTATSANNVKVTVESVKAKAKGIALTSDDPNECMEQIREVVGVIAESCYENANVGLDKFEATGLILLDEELARFVYKAPEPENTGGDGLDI